MFSCYPVNGFVRLTKTGNAYLRYYMVEAANSVRLSCPEEFGSYYQKKFAEATRHSIGGHSYLRPESW
jgi:hypothetical protein